MLIRAEWENEDWKGYFLRIEDDGDVTMGIRDDVGWNTRETGNADRYRPGQPNRLGIAAKGNLIIGFVNDQRVGFFRDDSLKLGEIGLVSERIGDEAVVVYFDNLEVKVRQEDDCIKGGENL
ncbi:hypothetical protein [Scytonema sp. PRP1]|uniref:hypothetical protein n=1 Tax=Scytonema sp. PRP1 TaxID=3120513 RepID=UPI00300CF54E